MTTPPSTRLRWCLAIGLLLLSPLCAEYVQGYLPSTGDPTALLGGLLILAPLYGAPALLIRETAVRTGMRWPGVIALATAAGLLQAGVVDQSLFSSEYQSAEPRPAFLAAMGLSIDSALPFLVGHAVWSFSIPIALIQAAHPASAGHPWLRRTGLGAAGGLYLVAAALIHADVSRSGSARASLGQVVGTLAAAGLLVAWGLTVGRRPRPLGDATVPPPTIVGLLGLTTALVFNLAPESTVGMSVGAATVLLATVTISRLSRSERWNQRHVVMLATGALIARAVVGFLAQPMGEVTPLAKYAHNTVFLAGSLALGLWIYRCTGRACARSGHTFSAERRPVDG